MLKIQHVFHFFSFCSYSFCRESEPILFLFEERRTFFGSFCRLVITFIYHFDTLSLFLSLFYTLQLILFYFFIALYLIFVFLSNKLCLANSYRVCRFSSATISFIGFFYYFLFIGFNHFIQFYFFW